MSMWSIWGSCQNEDFDFAGLDWVPGFSFLRNSQVTLLLLGPLSEGQEYGWIICNMEPERTAFEFRFYKLLTSLCGFQQVTLRLWYFFFTHEIGVIMPTFGPSHARCSVNKALLMVTVNSTGSLAGYWVFLRFSPHHLQGCLFGLLAHSLFKKEQKQIQKSQIRAFK